MTFPSKHLQGEILKKLERVVHIRTTKKHIVEASGQTEQSNQGEELTKKKNKEKVPGMDYFETNILIATLVATVTFAAAFQVPGGYDDNGKAILSKNKYFLPFMIFDSLAFGFSAASVFIQFFSSNFSEGKMFAYPKLLVLILNEVGILFALGAFLFGIPAVLAEKSSLAIATECCVLCSFCFSVGFLFYKIRRLLSRSLKCLGFSILDSPRNYSAKKKR